MTDSFDIDEFAAIETGVNGCGYDGGGVGNVVNDWALSLS